MYNTLNNPSAHPSYSHYYLLSPSTLFFFFCTSYSFLHILLFFAHLIVFCTSYCFALFFYFIAHFTLISLFLTICMPLCYVTLYNLYSYYFALPTERTWFDYISLLIIPCITYYVTNKETLTLTLTLIMWMFSWVMWSQDWGLIGFNFQGQWFCRLCIPLNYVYLIAFIVWPLYFSCKCLTVFEIFAQILFSVVNIIDIVTNVVDRP